MGMTTEGEASTEQFYLHNYMVSFQGRSGRLQSMEPVPDTHPAPCLYLYINTDYFLTTFLVCWIWFTRSRTQVTHL